MLIECMPARLAQAIATQVISDLAEEHGEPSYKQ